MEEERGKRKEERGRRQTADGRRKEERGKTLWVGWANFCPPYYRF